MIDWSSCPAVERDPARVDGAWVFRGTRVPVAALFENLEDGAQVQDFVDWFPGVSLAQVRAVLVHATRSPEAASVRVLFDQGVPAPLARLLGQYEVTTAFQMGWSVLSNGDLLAQAEAPGFDVLIATDQNLRNQQDLRGRHLAILGLSTTSWRRIRQATPATLDALDRLPLGAYSQVLIP